MAKKKSTTLLSKDDILAVDDRQEEIIEVPEWGGHVRLIGLDAWEQSEYEQSLMSAETDDDGNVKMVTHMEGADIRLAAMGIRDEDGNAIFSVDDLRTKSGRAIKRVADRVRKLSGMDAQSRKAAEGN